MTSRDFCYWLQGFMEISGTKELTPEQLQIIKNHLGMVFKHEIDPSHGDKAHQSALSDIHEKDLPPHLRWGVDPECKLNC